MFCPCCAGRTSSSIHHLDQSVNSDGDDPSLTPDQFETHRTSELWTPRIPGDLLSVPLPAITHLPVEFVRHRLPDWIYGTRIQRHAIWDYLSVKQICAGYAERLLLENDKKLSRLYIAEELLGGLWIPGSLTKEGLAGSRGSSCGEIYSHDHPPRYSRWWQGDIPQQQAWYG